MRSKEQKTRHTASRQLFGELAAKNVKKSARDYLIYFMTLTLAVALFYTFNSIDAQFSIMGIPDTFNYLSFSAGMMAGISIFICLIMAFLVVYANRFILKRRKREIGLYMTLGMEERDIRGLMWKETCLIGGVSLASGLALGIGLSQGLAMVTAKIAGVGLGGYHFVLSVKAVVAAVFFFVFMFFIVYRLNVRKIKNMQLIELIHASQKNEHCAGGRVIDILLCIASAALLIAGYVILFSGITVSFTKGLFFGAVLITAGTILLCLSVSGLYVKLCKKNKSYYYSRLHIFIVNQLGSKLKDAGLSIGIVSILICLSISSIAVGLGMGKYLTSDAGRLAPYDISIWMDEQNAGNSSAEEGGASGLPGIDLSQYIGQSEELKIYRADGITNSLFKDKEALGTDKDKDWAEYDLDIIGADDYNRLLELQGAKPVMLRNGEYAVNYNEKTAKEQLEYYVKHAQRPLKINGKKLTLAKEGLYQNVIYNYNVLADGGSLIVPQDVADGLTLYRKIYSGKFLETDSYRKFIETYLNTAGSVRFYAKKDILTEMTSNNLTFTYIGVYMGITFLIIAGAVVALQQLSQSSDNEKRYELLRKLGAQDKDIKESLMAQLKVYFGLPFVLAAVNAAVIIAGVFGNMDLGVWTIIQTVIFSAGIVIFVYGLYYMVTYAGSRRILDV